MCMLTFMDTSIMYNLTVMNIVAPTAAHIHSGAVGKLLAWNFALVCCCLLSAVFCVG